MINARVSRRVHRELILALEAARNRLAIAVASETKSTTPERRQYYLETADRARRMVRELRETDCEAGPARHDWIAAIDKLRRVPSKGEALQYCRIVHDVVMALGKSGGAMREGEECSDDDSVKAG